MRTVLVMIALTGCSLHGTRRPRLSSQGEVLCTDDIGVPVFDAVFAASSLVLGVMVYTSMRDEPGSNSADSARGIATPFAFSTALGIGSAIYGYRNVKECKRAKRLEIEEHAAARVRRKQRKQSQRIAWQVTKHAMQSARAGDCSTVATLDGEVRNLDEDFYKTVFLQDAAIARCLATTKPAPDAPPAPDVPPPSSEKPPVLVPPPPPIEKQPILVPPPAPVPP